MKKILPLLIAAVLVSPAIVSCSFDDPADEPTPETGTELLFQAGFEENDETKTSTDEAGAKVFWSPHEDINIFYGASEGSKFTSVNDETASVAGFSGTLTAFIGANDETLALHFWGVYPYQEDSECDGESVTVTLPSEQVATKGTFADNTLITVAYSQGLALSFKHVCSGYRFKVVNPNVTSMTFRGNNGETVAGKVKVSIDASGGPVWEPIEGEGVTEVTLTAPEGTVFDTDAFYYLIVLPQVFENGFTMTFRTNDLQKGEYPREESVTFTRGKFKNNAARDADVEYKDIYEAIDLGLSVKWASVNIGAESPEEIGDYYAWGETTTKDNYSWATYTHANGSNTTLTKYNSDEAYGSVVDNKTTLDPEDDVAYVTLGGDWRMPTWAEWQELLANTTWSSATMNGVTGWEFVSNEDASALLFFPITGYQDGNKKEPPTYGKTNGFYWSSTRGETSNVAYRTMFSVNGVVSRHYGMVVRAVKAIPVEGISLDRTSLSLGVDDNVTLTATLTPAKVTNSTLTWTSSNPSVASVDADGTVVGLKSGSAVITVSAGSKSATCDVTVSDVSDLATPLCLEAAEDGTFTFSNPLGLTVETKKNGGDWTASSDESIEIAVSAGDRVYFRGDNAAYATSDDDYSNIGSTAKCYVYGNIMSLIDSDGFATLTTLTGNYALAWLFHGNSYLENHPERDLKLPATTLSASCYRGMFESCSSLVKSPELPATQLPFGPYKFMFMKCKSLVTAPDLPAMSVPSNGYFDMFYDCTSLVVAPSLPATSVAEQSYQGMFYGCTSLTSAPASLPANTVKYRSYYKMFQSCKSLVKAPELSATILNKECYAGMFNSCTSLIAAPVLPATTLAVQCYHGMFYGCTSLTSAPELPATTLSDLCYSQMFRDCTSLVEAPELPATTLAKQCYYEMFRYNTKMVTAPALPATTLAEGCYRAMFRTCYALKNAPALPATMLSASCYYDMFYLCSALEQAPELPAETLVENCYYSMFGSCSKLGYIKMLATDISAEGCMTNWVSGVASTGTFVKNFDATWDEVGVNGVPEGWTVETAFTRDQVHVTGASLDKNTLAMTPGGTATLTATVSPTDADIKDVTWKSSNTSVATVDVNGKVTAVAAGTAMITVTTADGSKTATCEVTVTVPVTGVSLNKTTLALNVGGSETLTATIAPTNATNTTVTWKSSNTSVATVSNGKVTAVAAGSATITVTTADGSKTATCAVTVTVPVTGVSLNKTTLALNVGGSETLTATIAPTNATNTAVTWSSSNTSVVTVSGGKITAVGAGTATITVTTSDGSYTAKCTVTVGVPVTGVSLNKTTLSLSKGSTETLTATIAPTNATNTAVTWKSSNTSVATVDSDGKVTAVTAGTATITVTTADGSKTATCTVTVTVPVTGVSLNKTTLSLSKGSTGTLTATISPTTATNKDVTWSSSNTSVATVDADGVVTAIGAGSAKITVTTVDGNKTASCTVTVKVPVTGVTLDKTAITLPVGGTYTLVSTVAPTDASNKNVSWSTSNILVASVSDGKITAIAKGTATITVYTDDGEYTATCVVTVDPSESSRNDYSYSTGWED